MLAVGVVVVAENLQQAVFLEQLIVPGVVDVGVKQCCDLDVRVLLLEDAVVLPQLLPTELYMRYGKPASR